MSAQVLRLHYVLAPSGESAVALSSLIEAGRIPAMALDAGELATLADLHPMGYRPRLLPFLVCTGKSEPEFRLLGENP